MVIAYQIFGSEELSAKSKSIRERMTGAYVAVSPSDAEDLSLKQGDEVNLNEDEGRVIVCIRTKIKKGTAAVYCGDNEIDRHALGGIVTLNKCENKVSSHGIQGLIVSDLYEEAY